MDDIIDISSLNLDDPMDSGWSQSKSIKTSNFGGGIELLMNDKVKEGNGSSRRGSDIDLEDLNNLEKDNEIDIEISSLQKKLFDLRMKRLPNQNINSHFFKHYKRKIAQLHFKKSALNKQK